MTPYRAPLCAAMAGEGARAGLGFAFDVFDPSSFDAAIGRIIALSGDEIRAMSERGFSGEAALGNTREGWIDAKQAKVAGAKIKTN